jgi:hypothetical protein
MYSSSILNSWPLPSFRSTPMCVIGMAPQAPPKAGTARVRDDTKDVKLTVSHVGKVYKATMESIRKKRLSDLQGKPEVLAKQNGDRSKERPRMSTI